MYGPGHAGRSSSLTRSFACSSIPRSRVKRRQTLKPIFGIERPLEGPNAGLDAIIACEKRGELIASHRQLVSRPSRAVRKMAAVYSTVQYSTVQHAQGRPASAFAMVVVVVSAASSAGRLPHRRCDMDGSFLYLVRSALEGVRQQAECKPHVWGIDKDKEAGPPPLAVESVIPSKCNRLKDAGDAHQPRRRRPSARMRGDGGEEGRDPVWTPPC